MKFSYRVFTFFIFFVAALPTNSRCITPSCLIGSYALCVSCCLAYTDYEVETAATKNGLTFKAMDKKIETIAKNFQTLIAVLAPHLKTLGSNQRTLAQALHLPNGNPSGLQTAHHQQPPQYPTALHIAIPPYNPSATPTSQTPPPPPGVSRSSVVTPPLALSMDSIYSALPMNAPDGAPFSSRCNSASSYHIPYEECQ